MVVVPGDTPVTIPVVPTVAADCDTAGLHVPPVTPSVSVVVAPAQTVDVPLTGVGEKAYSNYLWSLRSFRR